MELSKLAPRHGARKSRRRVGRGESSGVGKTSGKGGKGQTARSGGHVRPGFEGGQMPLYRRLPKFGFTSRTKVLGLNQYHVINLSKLDKFENGSTVDADAILAKRYGNNNRNKAGIKVLGTGELTKKLHVKVHAISASAKAKIESLGGSVELLQSKQEVAAQTKEAGKKGSK
ncbi:MAG: 50S ribosomal protein L15 [Deltaproteobacteria bacterium]|nr:50S ribosomal protein L15 [Deltaproteobacteria bacterium]